MAERINLTMAAIARLKSPSTGQRWLYDLKTPGLVVLVTATGSKAFYWYRKVNGRPERQKIGGFPTITVDTAREVATKWNAGLADGINPVEMKRKQRGELTLGQLWELFVEFHAVAHKKPRSVAEDRGLWNRYLKPLEHRKLSTIASPDVQALHSKIGKANGKFGANRMLSLLSKMFAVAKQHGVWHQANPCEGVKKFQEKSRDRFLQADEVPRFFTALDGLKNQTAANVFRLLLLTGARKSNVLSMRWQDLDLTAAVWRIPDTKQGEPQQVHLPAEAVAILTAIKSTDDPAAVFVFPSTTTVGYLGNVTLPWKEVCEAAKLPGLRIHDLRRTLGSWQALQGASLPIIGKSLGHKNSTTTQIYARLQLDPVRASVDKAVSAMMATAKTAEQVERVQQPAKSSRPTTPVPS